MTAEKVVTLFENSEDDMLCIDCPYHEEWLKDFKEAVPYEDRNPRQGYGWDKTDKIWIVPLDYAEVVEELVKKHFPDHRVQWEYL